MWAKIIGYPWWPGVVNASPSSDYTAHPAVQRLLTQGGIQVQGQVLWLGLLVIVEGYRQQRITHEQDSKIPSR